MVERFPRTICTKILLTLRWWYFLTVQGKGSCSKVFHYMNSRHPKIKFTCEEENNNKISFLDISETRTANKITTSIFRKKKFIGVYLNFHSHLPTDYKKGLIDTLLHRSYNIRSNYTSFHQEILFLKSVWQQNSFPLFFIDKCVKKFLDKLFIKSGGQGAGGGMRMSWVEDFWKINCWGTSIPDSRVLVVFKTKIIN